jgi:hypothetical protein
MTTPLYASPETPLPLRDLYLSIEAELHYRIERSIAFDWNEDFLSRTFCEILRDRSPFTFLTFDGETAETNVFFKKQSGKQENLFGDIGALVRIVTKDGTPITAWGYLEAKRRYRDSGEFDEIRWDQLERIEKNAPHAMLLLYDFIDIGFNEDVSGDAPLPDPPATRSVVVPIALARALGTKSIGLYQAATPLAHQLCYRYLHGLDLQPVKEFTDIQRFFGDLSLVPAYLLDIRVRYETKDTDNDTASSIPPPTPSDEQELEDQVMMYRTTEA